MKKFTSILISMAMLTGFASCAEQDKSNENSQTSGNSFTAEKLSDKAYKKEKLPTFEGMNLLFAVRNSPCGNLLIGSSDEESPVFFMSDKKFQNPEKIVIDNFKTGENYEICVSADGSIITFVIEKDKETEDYSCWLRKYSSKGELLSEVEFTELYDEISPQDITFDGGICSSDGKNIIACLNGSYYCFDVDGHYKGELILTDEKQQIKEIGMDSDGQIWGVVRVDVDNIKLCRIDAENGKIDENGSTYNIGGSIVAPIMTGTGDYTMYLMGRTQIFGIEADGSIEPVFSITNSDINTNMTSVFTFDEKGQLIAPKLDMTGVKFVRYVEIDPAELENIPVMKIGCYDKSWLSDFAEYVNEDQSDYRLEFVEYGDEIGNLDMQKDFISGNVPDILECDQFEGLNLGEKGVLCDLYEFMDKDDEMNRDAFNSNLLHLAEENGKLYSLYRDVYVDVMFGKKKYAGDNLNWSADDFIEACEKRPDGMYAFQNSNPYLDALNAYSFVDFDKKKCYFDSEEFLKICKFAESRSDFMERSTEYDFQFADMEHPTREEQEKWDIIRLEEQMTYINEKSMLLGGSGFGSIRGAFLQKVDNFNLDDVQVYGYITPDGGQPIISFANGLAVSTKCENKEFAWDIVKRFMLYQNERMKGYDALSMLNSLLDAAIKNALNPPEGYIGEKGYPNNFTGEYVGAAFTQADVDEVMNILNTAKYTTLNQSRHNVWDIYYEERDKFMNHEYTAEQFVDMLQNRLSIAVAE